ncbi:serine hydrolase domain-containing protein [Bosea sp. BH3]|uniref:serine hydrolase domain-containing protein n=1 Tax=Bosea sp. BH3 TaxID=2871701 RepID=UPI0021CB0B90|nr:serine hydrolase domain-containing protein [Bosea sp. BH3]MCU4179609.1 serine hydrolase [Bosea sp. BH3]
MLSSSFAEIRPAGAKSIGQLCRSLVAAVLVALPCLEPARAETSLPKIEALIPELEKQIATGLKEFGVPGASVGIVFDDKLIYSKGFGVRTVGKSESVTPDTLFQIGSTTKAFLAASLAQAVDAGRLKWTDPVIDHLPAFQLADPWITRDFRILDLAAQRSGLTAYVNDSLALLGYDKDTLIRSLRVAPQTGIFRSDFRYLNIPHVVAGEIVAKVNGANSWFDSVKRSLLDPLGMTSTSMTPEAIDQAANHAVGHRPEGRPLPIPFHFAFPYSVGPAGAFNSNVKDMAQWLRLHLGRGQFDGKVLVSEQNLDVTWTPRVAMNERLAYAMGWVASATPNGRIIWHNGGTTGFGAHVGFLPDHKVGIVILTNLGNSSMADSLAQWFYDRALGNPQVDNIALGAAAVRAGEERERKERVSGPAVPLPARAAEFAGSYASPILGTATVAIVDGKLRMTLEETEAVVALEPVKDEPSLFSASLAPTPAFAPIVAMTGEASFTQVRFERDGAGRPVLRWLSPELPHVFTREPGR